MDLALLAYCGLYCGACSFKLARDTNDMEHVRRMPARYDAHKHTLPEACPGCRLENQCGPCAIRDCARGKALDHCGQCRDFPCERLLQFSRDGVPHHGASLANLEAVAALGAEAWLEDQKARWTAPDGTPLSWYLPADPGAGIRRLRGPRDLEAASRLAAAGHARLREALPFLPARESAHFLPKLAWMAREGELLGLCDATGMRAFLGGFILENFRNAGMGAFCPDWCHGADPDVPRFEAYRALYRELAPRWKARGAHIHAAALYATDHEALRAFSMTGFGRVMMDAARPVADLLAELAPEAGPGCRVRRAAEADAPALADLDAARAAHIAGSPVLMPDVHGRDEAAWRAWFAEPDAVACLAADGDGDGDLVTGYITAQEPQIDVTDAVHDARTLAINGAYVRPDRRGQGTGGALLLALARHARDAGKELLSVDCETMNPEAFAFWSRGFRPVAWGLERRT